MNKYMIRVSFQNYESLIKFMSENILNRAGLENGVGVKINENKILSANLLIYEKNIELYFSEIQENDIRKFAKKIEKKYKTWGIYIFKLI